jgi:hypothetical protein
MIASLLPTSGATMMLDDLAQRVDHIIAFPRMTTSSSARTDMPV